MGMRVLFIGGTGVISRSVSELALSMGIELYLLNRGTRALRSLGDVESGARHIASDIRDFRAVEKSLKSLDFKVFDAVVDWVAYTPEHIEADIRHFSGRTGQYVFISTASAYQKPSCNYLITESTPLCNPFWQYARDKIACEGLLTAEYRRSGFPVTIVRPSYTYDRTMIPFLFNSRPHRWTLVDRMLRGRKVIVPGDGTSLYSLTHSRDFAKGFNGLLGNIHAIGHAFHITTDEVLTWNQAIEAIGAAAGVKPEIIHIPSDFIAAASPDHLGGLLGDKSVSAVHDNSKIKAFVPGYNATIPFSKGIRESVAWYESHPEMRTVDNGFNALCDRIIDAYEHGLSLLA